MRIFRTMSFLFMFALAACNGGSVATAPVPTPTPNLFPIANTPVAFYRDYTGPQRNSILAVAAGGTFVAASQTIVLNAKMAGAIVDGNTNYYVWGFNRGAATNAPFPDEANVKFDSVMTVTVTPAGTLTAVVNLLNGTTAGVTATLIAADSISVTIPVANLPPTTTVTPNAYVWNLWPRSGVGGAAAAQIASFIPENAMAPFAQQ